MKVWMLETFLPSASYKESRCIRYENDISTQKEKTVKSSRF